MKKNYIKPSIEDTNIQFEDVLTISQNLDGKGTEFNWGDITWEEIK